MRIAVFGASGRTGERVVERALDRGHEVTAFVRDAARLDAADGDLRVVEGDAYTGMGVEEAVADADAVVSVLGQSSDGPDDLLTVAGEHVMDAMAAHGVERYVTLVGAGVRVEGDSVSVAGRILGGLLKLVQGEVLEDAETHVADVRSRDLAWTVVRTPRLSDGDARGEYRTGNVAPGATAVSRGDVAAFVLDCVEEERYVRELPRITY
jgi:putative NADH-flavin reductase